MMQRAIRLAAVVMALGGCANTPLPPDPNVVCAALAVPVAAAAIGLPSGGATIDSATLFFSSSLSVAERAATPAATVTPALPQYCRLLGRIAPVDPKAPPIHFQVNLPAEWNGRSVQYGGGGFNGVLITALGLPPGARFDQPGPLARGYVTYGTDSGHQNAPGVPVQAFAANDEALLNFAHASYKKVRDVAVELMKRRYGRAPDKLYFMGSSEGGREGLTMAQRYPNDFDGIFARVPVIHWVGLQHAYLPPSQAMMGGEGWLNPAQVKLLGDAVLRQCDADDGLVDGIVANVEGCRAKFNVNELRCAVGQTGDCLTHAQVRAVQAHHAEYLFDFSLANGVRSYPGRPLGGEGTPGSGPVGGWVSWLTGQEAPAWPATLRNSIGWVYGSGAMVHFIARDPAIDIRQYEPGRYAQRVREVSALMDSTDPDLSAFHARGGKLIVLEHMADYAQSPYAGIEYFKNVSLRLGTTRVDSFMRLYTAPGVDHVGTGAPANVDMLGVLSDWVERAQAPDTLEVVMQANVAPFTPSLSRPLCRWPAWPRYKGAGDAALAASFDCVTR